MGPRSPELKKSLRILKHRERIKLGLSFTGVSCFAILVNPCHFLRRCLHEHNESTAQSNHLIPINNPRMKLIKSVEAVSTNSPSSTISTVSLCCSWPNFKPMVAVTSQAPNSLHATCDDTVKCKPPICKLASISLSSGPRSPTHAWAVQCGATMSASRCCWIMLREVGHEPARTAKGRPEERYPLPLPRLPLSSGHLRRRHADPGDPNQRSSPSCPRQRLAGAHTAGWEKVKGYRVATLAQNKIFPAKKKLLLSEITRLPLDAQMQRNRLDVDEHVEGSRQCSCSRPSWLARAARPIQVLQM
jgi:hypothetical protein